MAEPIGVLHVVDCLNVGGTEHQMFELLRRLDRRRWRPLVACFKGGELLSDLRGLDIEPFTFPLPGSLARLETAHQVMRMAWMCHQQKVRIIHAHDFYSNVIGVAAATLSGARAIASRRDLAHWLSPRQRTLLRLALRMSDCVIANADAVGALVRASELADVGKLHIVPNGIDVAHFDALAAREPESPLPPPRDGAPRVVMVASMHLPDKGHGDLLEAAAQLHARGQKIDWWIVSDGVLRATHEERARTLGIADQIHFLGRREDVPAVLRHADLVVHPSWSEGFPNAILEAMCAGKPVVATRVGGCPELVTDGENGLLVEPHQPAHLARAIESLLADPERARQMGRLGRARVESSYSLERMSQTVDDIYSSLAA